MKAYLCFWAIIGLTACSEATKKTQLENNVRNYFLSLRRADSTATMSYVHPEKRGEFMNRVARLDHFRVSLAEVETIFPNENLTKAVVSARLEFFSPEQMGLHSIKRSFNWIFHPEAKTWLLDEKEPFGSPLQKP
jgi:hypothetical protein